MISSIGLHRSRRIHISACSVDWYVQICGWVCLTLSTRRLVPIVLVVASDVTVIVVEFELFLSLLNHSVVHRFDTCQSANVLSSVSVYLTVGLTASLHACLHDFLFVCLIVCLSVCLFVYLSLRPSVRPFVRISFRPSVYVGLVCTRFPWHTNLSTCGNHLYTQSPTTDEGQFSLTWSAYRYLLCVNSSCWAVG